MTKSTITREQLLEIIETDHVQCGEASYLARMALAAMDSEPVAYIFKHPAGRLFWSLTDESNKGHDDVMPVYASPQPAPEEWTIADAVKFCKETGRQDAGAAMDAWNACRAAMLKAQPQNAPQNIPEIIPDGWIPVSEHLPKEKGVYQVWNGKYVDNVPFWFGSFQSLHSELITHWMPLPAGPQEVR